MTVLRLLFIMLAFQFCSSPACGEDEMRKSAVKIFATQRRADIFKPWTKKSASDVSGSGAIIDGKRILTNAHVIKYARQIYVQPYQSADKIAAKVVAVAPGMDLALLELEDESIFDSHPPFPMAVSLPKPGASVTVYGYPIGGTEISMTEGVVSRIEFSSYYFGVSGLRIQVDAALNSGNSGGPALSAGKMIGVVFSRIKEADNIGYIIPVEEINLFIEDVSDGSYDGKPMIYDELQTLENDALRAKLGLKKDQQGIMVNHPYWDEEHYPLKKWDIIARVGEYSVDNEGKILCHDGLRLGFMYMVQRLASNDKIALGVIRDGVEIAVDVPTLREPSKLLPYLKYQYPSYFIYGPLVFSPASTEHVRYLKSAWHTYLFGKGSPLTSRFTEQPSFEGEGLVIVSAVMFSHRITKGYDDPFAAVVGSVNGQTIKNFRHFVEVIRDLSGPYVELTFPHQRMETMVFRRKDMEAATEEILEQNGIRKQCSKDVEDILRVK